MRTIMVVLLYVVQSFTVFGHLITLLSSSIVSGSTLNDISPSNFIKVTNYSTGNNYNITNIKSSQIEQPLKPYDISDVIFGSNSRIDQLLMTPKGREPDIESELKLSSSKIRDINSQVKNMKKEDIVGDFEADLNTGN